jgi:hypothetical protein
LPKVETISCFVRLLRLGSEWDFMRFTLINYEALDTTIGRGNMPASVSIRITAAS